MDNITHSLFGATLARTPLGRAGRGTTAALVLASNAPDIDIVATAGGTLKYLEWHRGPTHGPLGIVGLGLLTAGLVYGARQLIDRGRTPGAVNVHDNASFVQLAGISILGVLFHVLMDLPTSYGTHLQPIRLALYAFDWMPIVDIYLLGAPRHRPAHRPAMDGAAPAKRRHRAVVHARQLRRPPGGTRAGDRAGPANLRTGAPRALRILRSAARSIDGFPRHRAS